VSSLVAIQAHDGGWVSLRTPLVAPFEPPAAAALQERGPFLWVTAGGPGLTEALRIGAPIEGRLVVSARPRGQGIAGVEIDWTAE
jgi:hypothetical protein